MTDLPPGARRLLSEPSTAHLATLLPDGSPHSVPLWVGLEGEYVAFLTSPNSRKALNIARDPRVAISLTRRDAATDMAYLRGRVVKVVDGDAGWAIIDRLSDKYLGMPYPVREDRVAYLVEVSHAGAASF
jgi:PPOX class probable F420-dependent enzyme